VRVHKGVFFRGIGKRAVEGGLICLFFIGVQSGAAKPV
jgi:hypothetical protein